MRRLSIGTSFGIDCNLAIFGGPYTNKLVYASCVGYQGIVNNITKAMKERSTTGYLTNKGSFVFNSKEYEIEKVKDQNSELVHFVLKVKDNVVQDTEGDDILEAYLYFRTPEELNVSLYNKLSKYLSVPLIREWMPYLCNELARAGHLSNTQIFKHGIEDVNIAVYSLNVKASAIITIITNGLATGALNINGCTVASEVMLNVNGLDEYLNTFGETLATSIKETFAPKFDPENDTYSQVVEDFDDYCYDEGNGIQIYDAQKTVIQASVNQLNVSKNCLVIGEMGTGKTLIGSAITYCHGKQTGSNIIVMCPSHLVEKWKREIERFVPNGEAMIIKNLTDLVAAEKVVKNKARQTNLYLIMSKDSAKFDYETRPGAVWNAAKKTYCCVECGQELYKEEYVGTGRGRYKVKKKLEKLDMLKPNSFNQICPNSIKKYDSKQGEISVKCNAKQWIPVVKEDMENGLWTKIGAEGWVLKDHIMPLFDELNANRSNLDAKHKKIFAKLAKKKIEMMTAQKEIIRAPRKYALSKYIKKYMRGYIDYFVADELHLYKSDSKQGQAMADIIKASKKFIGLTGTLLNGYAEGLFYILYRTMPQEMMREGFQYNDVASFMREYGVIKKTSLRALSNGRVGDSFKSNEKKLPGVSPIVFTKFLLDNAVFLSLSDMAEGLPEYNEYPIGVAMDAELNHNYSAIEDTLRSAVGGFEKGKSKILSQMLQTLTTFPDMPYNQPPVINLDTDEVVLTPPSLAEGLRNKEDETLAIIDEKIANGEKVLVYYQWTNKTDTAQKLQKAIRERGYNVSNLTASVKADEREAWIEKKVEEGCQVLLCNPTLVETGLDLLDFTTIIFYQVGYNIFTMRQASRRSWRLGQDRPISVYFMYYQNTVQEQALSLMATKLQASMAIEGKFTEEGLRAMSNNEDILTKIAESVVSGIKDTVTANSFSSVSRTVNLEDSGHTVVTRKRKKRSQIRVFIPRPLNAREQAIKNILTRKTSLAFDLRTIC